MRKQKVKADWAGISLSEDGGVVICTKTRDDAGCIWFSSPDQLTEALSSRALSVKRWAIAVPRKLCIEKTLVLPASDFAEAAKMVEFELSSLVPLPKDKIVYGCSPKSQEKNTVTVSVTLLRTSALAELLRPYRDLSIEPTLIVVDSLAIQSWFESHDAAGPDLCLSVFMDRQRGIVLSSRQGRLQAVEDLVWPAETHESGYAGVAAHLIQASTLLSGSAADPAPHVVLGGGDRITRSAKEGLDTLRESGQDERTRISIVPNPTSRCQPFNGEQDRSSRLVFECCLAIGSYHLASRSLQPYANLVPADSLRRQERRSRLRGYLVSAGMSAACVLMLCVAFVTSGARIRRASGQIEAMIAPVEQIAGDVENKRLLVNAIERQFAGRGKLSQVLRDLSRSTNGSSVTLHDLRFESKQNECLVEVKGQASSNAAVWELPDLLQAAQLLQNIEIQDIATKSDRSGQSSTTEFKLHCLIRD